MRWSRIGGSGGAGREKREDAAAEFFGLEAQGGGVEGARDDPELFGAARGGVDHFRMAAGKRLIHFIANEENGKRAGGDGFYRGNFRDRKTGEFFIAIQQRPGAGSEESLAEPGVFSQAGVIVRRFAEIGEGGFGNDGFDAGIGGRGLQRDAGAHGFAEGEDMKRSPRKGNWRMDRLLQAGFFDGLEFPFSRSELLAGVAADFGPDQFVDDGAGVDAFEPAVGGGGAAAGAVGAGVHHDDAIAGAQQEFGLTDDADAVVSDSVEEEYPAAVGIFRADFPTTERRSIRCLHVEIFTAAAGDCEGGVGFAEEVGRQLAADGVEERRAGEPAADSRQERREEK